VIKIVGEPIIYFTVFVMIAVVLWSLMICVSYFPKKLAESLTSLARAYRLRAILLRFVFEAYFEILIGVFLNSYHLEFHDVLDWVNSILTILLAILAFNLPLYVFHKTVASVTPVDLNFSLYRAEYGSIYEGIRINSKISLFITVIFLF